MELSLTNLSVLEERVNRGAQLLDLHRPGWAREVEIDQIEITCPLHSVTGQLFGPEIDDQMIAIGIMIDGERPWLASDAFAEAGFCVLRVENIRVTDDIRTRINALVVELSAVVGREMTRVAEIPEVIPYPRDLDVATQEAFTIELLWEKATRARL